MAFFLLGIINLAILIVCIALLVLGILLIVAGHLFNQYFQDYTDKAMAVVKQSGVPLKTEAFDDIDFAAFLAPVASLLIAISCVIGSVALIGYVGCYMNLRTIVKVYLLANLVILIGQLIFFGCMLGIDGFMEDMIKPPLKDSLAEYKGLASAEPSSLAWNALMSYKDCCGVTNYGDFSDLEYWPPSMKDLGVTHAPMPGGAPSNNSSPNVAGADGTMAMTLPPLDEPMNLETPIACCKTVSKDFSCAMIGTASPEINNMHAGCYLVVEEFFLSTPVVAGMGVLVLVQCFLVAFTVWSLYITPIPAKIPGTL